MKKLWFLATVSFFCFNLAYAGDNEGTAGAAFLKLPSSAKAIGMGGAYSALSTEVNSLFINPAGLAHIKHHSFATTYIGWVEGVNTGILSYAFPSTVAKGVVSTSLLYMRSDEIEERDSEKGELIGATYVRGGVAALSYGRPINERLSLGGNLKFIWEELDEENGLATALDLGLLFEPRDRFSLGVAVKNIGSKIKIDEKGDKLPFSVQAGLAYRFKDVLTLACDVESSNDSSLRTHTGAEYWYKDRVAFRAGYNQTGSELDAPAGLTLGASFKATSKTRTKNNILSIVGCLSYAYFSLGDLEDCHIISYEAEF